jgi:hypothetical protein
MFAVSCYVHYHGYFNCFAAVLGNLHEGDQFLAPASCYCRLYAVDSKWKFDGG